jgi:hypothetical protein
LMTGTPLPLCVTVGWNGTGAWGLTIGAACAAWSARNTAGATYITTAIRHAVARIHQARLTCARGAASNRCEYNDVSLARSRCSSRRLVSIPVRMVLLLLFACPASLRVHIPQHVWTEVSPTGPLPVPSSTAKHAWIVNSPYNLISFIPLSPVPLRLPDPAFQRRSAPRRHLSEEISLQILTGSGELLRNIQEEFERKIPWSDLQSRVD